MRHVYKLLRACDRYGSDRVDQACERRSTPQCANVNIVIGMIERALETEQAAAEPVPDNVVTGRFARDPVHFAAGKRARS